MTTSLLVLALLAATPLTGIDLPPPAVIENATTIAALRDVVADRDASVIVRARAVRLLATMAVGDVSIDAQLTTLASTCSGELCVQIALGRFERASLRSPAAARSVASSTSTSAVSSLRKAAALMWWRIDDAAARGALSRCAAADVDHGVRAACRARLRRRPVQRGPGPGDLGTSTDGVVHDRTHAGSPTPPGR